VARSLMRLGVVEMKQDVSRLAPRLNIIRLMHARKQLRRTSQL